jgi:hypothetical protein
MASRARAAALAAAFALLAAASGALACRSVTMLEVQRLPDKATAVPSDLDTPMKVLDFLGTFTGLVDKIEVPPGNGARTPGARAKLERPDFLPWVNTRRHIFSDWDARDPATSTGRPVAKLGVPGGDLAEFALGMNALEHLRPMSEQFDQGKTDTYFQNYIALRDEFYVQTTQSAWEEWSRKLGFDPLRPLANVSRTQQVADVIESAPRYIWNQHIRLMRANEDKYGIRRLLLDQVIRSVFKVLTDDSPHKRKIKIIKAVMNEGGEDAFVNILSPEPSGNYADCAYTAPLIAADVGGENTIFAYHPRAVYEERALLAQYFADSEGQSENGDVAFRNHLFGLMCEIGNRQMEITKEAVAARLPTFVAKFY